MLARSPCTERPFRATIIAALFTALEATVWLGTGSAADVARAVPAPVDLSLPDRAGNAR
jgi:hypothetical protein